MTIHHFAADQNGVFLPALLAVLVATLLVVLPVVFAPGVRRAAHGRTIVSVAVVVAVLALTVAAWQAGIGFRTLQDERARVGTELRDDYGLDLDAVQVGALVDGEKLLRRGEPSVRLHPDGGDHYTVLLAGHPAARQA